jgi:thiamine biosynthesis lipoprotein
VKFSLFSCSTWVRVAALGVLACQEVPSNTAIGSTSPSANGSVPSAAAVPSSASAVSTASAASAAASADSLLNGPSFGDVTAFVPEKVWSEGKAMGTHLSFAAYTNPKVSKVAALAAWQLALSEFTRLESLMTTWRPDSEVSRINAQAGKAPVAVSPETYAVIEQSIEMAKMSEGTFDITFETLHGLWRFDEDLDPNPPKDSELKAKLKMMGYRHVKLDPKARTVFLDRPGVKIGLGGIAKGYAVDQAVTLLEKAGLTSFFVQAGGDLYARGKKPDGAEWSAGIRDPRGGVDKYFALLPLLDHSFSTAGDYERSYFVGERRYHHIIDPRTGYPATASRSVTIWAKSALLADAVDDAVFILGPEKGLALVEKLDGVGAVIVDNQNKVWISKRLEGVVRMTGAPTDAK